MLTSAASCKSGIMFIFNKIDTEGFTQIYLSCNLHDQFCSQSTFYRMSKKGKFCHVLPYFLITFCVENFVHVPYKMQQYILVPPLFPATSLLLWLLLLPFASDCLCKQAYSRSPRATAKQAALATINHN